MLSTLVKTVSAVLIATMIVGVIGVTYAVYQDQNLNVDASVTSWDEQTSTIGLKLIVKNKMAEDLKIIKISYKVYGDRAKTDLIFNGIIDQFTVPASQTASKMIMIKLLNEDTNSPKIYTDISVDYQLGMNPVAHLTISKAINLRALMGSGPIMP